MSSKTISSRDEQISTFVRPFAVKTTEPHEEISEIQANQLPHLIRCRVQKFSIGTLLFETAI